jgi:hypothetical protein
LGKGYTARIERDLSGARGDRHVHITNGDKTWAQNEDGEGHDGSSGTPPKSVQKALEKKTGWEWHNNNTNNYIGSLTVEIIALGLYDTLYEITYPDGSMVEVDVINRPLIMGMSTDQSLSALDISKAYGSVGRVYVDRAPVTSGVSMPESLFPLLEPLPVPSIPWPVTWPFPILA